MSETKTSLSFFCEKCQKEIEIDPRSYAFRQFQAGVWSENRAKYASKVAHNRHAHTLYDLNRKVYATVLVQAGVKKKAARKLARKKARMLRCKEI